MHGRTACGFCAMENQSSVPRDVHRSATKLSRSATRREMSICRYCHSLLPSEKAQQCFACGWDWYDPSNPKQLGDPNWNRFGLDPERDYVVELCQRPDGLRFTQYRQAENPRTDSDAVLDTVLALGSQFIEWGFYQYADHLTLTDGRRFTFDAHGIWPTRKRG